MEEGLLTSADLRARIDKFLDRHGLTSHPVLGRPVSGAQLDGRRNELCNIVDGGQRQASLRAGSGGREDDSCPLADVDEVVVGGLDAAASADAVALEPARGEPLHEQAAREDGVADLGRPTGGKVPHDTESRLDVAAVEGVRVGTVGQGALELGRDKDAHASNTAGGVDEVDLLGAGYRRDDDVRAAEGVL